MVFLPVWVQSVADVAEDVWDRYGFDFGTDYSGLFKALSHVNYNVRSAAAEALAAALDENPDTIQVVINSTCNLVTSSWCMFFFFLLISNKSY